MNSLRLIVFLIFTNIIYANDKIGNDLKWWLDQRKLLHCSMESPEVIQFCKDQEFKFVTHVRAWRYRNKKWWFDHVAYMASALHPGVILSASGITSDYPYSDTVTPQITLKTSRFLFVIRKTKCDIFSGFEGEFGLYPFGTPPGITEDLTPQKLIDSGFYDIDGRPSVNGVIRYDDFLQGGIYGYNFIKSDLVAFDMNGNLNKIPLK